jgi:4-amino-4-deoxy-L-arabinose transferase-like glycosyltransferase
MPFDASIRRRPRALAWIFAAMAIAALAVRVTAIAEPLGIDQSLWASAVRGMARGQRLYHDVWEQRPPGIYWIYLAGFRIFGWASSTVASLDVLAAACTTWFLVRSVRPLSSCVTASLAAALYAALTMPAWLYGYAGFLERSVCETFIVAAVALAASSAVRLRQDASIGAAVVMGLASGAAVVLKPNAGLYFPALMFWLVWYRSRPGAELLRPLVVAVLAAGVVPAIALLWLWRLDLLHDAKVAVIDFNRFYVSEGFSLTTYADIFSHAVFLRMKTEPLWAAGTMGSAVALWGLARRRQLDPMAALGLVWGAAATLVIVVNGARLFNTYFINALPPLAIMSAWLLGDSWRGSRVRQGIAILAAVFMIVLVATRGYTERVFGWAAADMAALRGREPVLTYLERFGSYANNRGYSARANEELASYIHERTTPEERIFLFGINGAGVYFSADRLTAHRFLRVNFFVATDFPDPAFRLPAVLSDLAASRPRYLIFEQLHGTSTMARTVDHLPNDAGVRALLAGYRLETQIEDFTVYRRLDALP